MHEAVVTCAAATTHKHGYVLTGDSHGIVKFWKRTGVAAAASQAAAGGGDAYATSASASQHQQSASCCLEFAKSFTAHDTPVLNVAIDADSNDHGVSISANLLKFYDIGSFDAVSIIVKDSTTSAFGRAACWFTTAGQAWLAVSSSTDNSIRIVSPSSEGIVWTVNLHAAPVTAMGYCHGNIVSTDSAGGMEVWDVQDTAGGGGPRTNKAASVRYSSKHETDFYCLLQKKTCCISLAVSSTHYALFCADFKLRVFAHDTGKLIVTFDERLQTAYGDKSTSSMLDSIEYGKRAATEREIQTESSVFSTSAVESKQQQQPPQHLTFTFDSTGQCLIFPCMLGIKILDWRNRKLLGMTGKADAGSLRFCSVILASGSANVNTQMLLARGGGVNSRNEQEEEATTTKVTDTLLIALAYTQRRVYVYSHIDPVVSGDSDALTRRDVWNEAPTVSDQLYSSTGNSRQEQATEKAQTKAILRTTMGDIHIQLYHKQVPKTIENFVGHCRSGYYDNVIFHRVIAGFMLQTGDPLGDGTGGESIWGGEFEDEIVPGLRHDRPYMVSMANAGPNTNGSQFFITTVPTPWLDGKHTVFGQVVRGMDVCNAIDKVKTDRLDRPLDEIRIHSVDLEQ
jgi:peptidylprolyl isomerase domain and WD repeat-containing protein 1